MVLLMVVGLGVEEVMAGRVEEKMLEVKIDVDEEESWRDL